MSDATPASTLHVKAKALALLGAAMVLLGALTYVPLLSVPWIRETGGPNLVLIVVGTGLGIGGAIRARRWWLGILAVGECLLTVVFVGFLFVLHLPPAPDAPPTRAEAPDFTLPDQEGRPVTLSSYRGLGPVLLVFYRGFW